MEEEEIRNKLLSNHRNCCTRPKAAYPIWSDADKFFVAVVAVVGNGLRLFFQRKYEWVVVSGEKDLSKPNIAKDIPEKKKFIDTLLFCSNFFPSPSHSMFNRCHFIIDIYRLKKIYLFNSIRYLESIQLWNDSFPDQIDPNQINSSMNSMKYNFCLISD